MNNHNGSKMTQEQWLKIIKQLSPRDVKIVEDSIRLVQNKNGRFTATPSQYTSAIRHGKTIERGRRNLKDEPVSDEEADRRSRRRERNRVAAAKCRQRRQSQIDYLQEEVNKLKKSGLNLQHELNQLAQKRQRLHDQISQQGLSNSNGSSFEFNCHPDSFINGVNKISSTTSSSICTVESDGLVNMDFDVPDLKLEPEDDSLLSQTMTPLVTRPSSLPIMRDCQVTSNSLPRITPLLTPSTANILSIPTTLASNDLNTPTDMNSLFNSGYLNLFSPSMDQSPLEMPGLMQSSQ